MMLDDLKKGMKKKLKKASPQRTRKIFDSLDEALQCGKTVSIVVLGNGKVRCYGERIDSSVLFDKLNMTSGTHGSRVTGQIAYPDLSRLTSYHKGYFVPASEFGGGDGDYVALVNIPLSIHCVTEIIPYRIER